MLADSLVSADGNLHDSKPRSCELCGSPVEQQTGPDRVCEAAHHAWPSSNGVVDPLDPRDLQGSHIWRKHLPSNVRRYRGSDARNLFDGFCELGLSGKTLVLDHKVD